MLALCNERHKPQYIGVTGATTPAQVQRLAQCFRGTPFVLMNGVLVSTKTLAGKKNKYPKEYPPVRRLSHFMVHDPHILNLAHLWLDDDDPAPLSDQMARVVDLSGPSLHGFQLNMANPNAAELVRFRRDFPLYYIVLQMGTHSLALAAEKGLGPYLEPYADLIDAVLVDLSGGAGVGMRRTVNTTLVRLLKNFVPHLHRGAAGGLGPGSCGAMEDALRIDPTLSCDAQKKLHNTPSGALNLADSLAYIEEMLRLMMAVRNTTL